MSEVPLAEVTVKTQACNGLQRARVPAFSRGRAFAVKVDTKRLHVSLFSRLPDNWKTGCRFVFNLYRRVHLAHTSASFCFHEKCCPDLAGPLCQYLGSKGGKACLSIRKHDLFTPTREIRPHVRALALF